MQERENLKKEHLEFLDLGEQLANIQEFLDLETLSSADTTSLQIELAAVAEKLARWETQLLLSGPYDAGGALITIRSGAGGTDAQDWTEMLLRMYLRYAERTGFRTSILDESRGIEAGMKSVTVELDGMYAYGYLRGEAGVHRLIRLSPFNADHLRQTSFASVEVLPVMPDAETTPIRSEDLKIDTFRASGAGGQHVNKTESAVRITHLPTGMVVQSQSERSQLQNKNQCLKILQAKLLQRLVEERALAEAKLRGSRVETAFGSQIRTYTLHPYTLVKDHRTGEETAQTQSVLDGDLDKFILSTLQYQYTKK